MHHLLKGCLSLNPGNDLARALNWGGGYTGERVMQLLLAIEDADTISLNRSVVENITVRTQKY